MLYFKGLIHTCIVPTIKRRILVVAVSNCSENTKHRTLSHLLPLSLQPSLEEVTAPRPYINASSLI